MSKHTPEPWDIFDIRLQSDFQPVAHIGQNDANEDLWVGQRHTQIHGGGPDEDARRIVACVNACKGISTERLEKMVPGTLANLIVLKGRK